MGAGGGCVHLPHLFTRALRFPLQSVPGEAQSWGNLPLNWSFQESIHLPGGDGGHLAAGIPQQKSPNDCLFKSYGLGGAADLADPTSTMSPTELYEKCKVSSARLYGGGDLLPPPVSGVLSDYSDLQTWNKNAALGRSPLSDNGCPSYPFPQAGWPYDFSPSPNALDPLSQQIPVEPPSAKTGCLPLWPNPGADLYEEKVHVDFNSYYPPATCHSPQEDPFLFTYTSYPHHQYSLPGKSSKWNFDEEVRYMGLDHYNSEMLLNLCPLR